MDRGRIWDIFQPNRSIFKFYPHITFDLEFHGQNSVWKIARHIDLKVWTFLCILIYEYPNTNKMGTGFYFKTYQPALGDLPKFDLIPNSVLNGQARRLEPRLCNIRYCIVTYNIVWLIYTTQPSLYVCMSVCGGGCGCVGVGCACRGFGVCMYVCTAMCFVVLWHVWGIELKLDKGLGAGPEVCGHISEATPP